VNQGEVVTLIGANGAGKTTILKTISKILEPTNGVVLFENEPLSKMLPHQLVYLGMAHVPEGISAGY
jgi:branched-chain amino acid transport system ATP-binding protein